MEGAKRTPLSARKKPMRKSRRLVRSIVTYLKADAYLYAPLFSPLPPPPFNLESSNEKDLHVGGKLQVTNLVTMESTSSRRTMRKDNNNYRNLSSAIAEHALHNGRISSPKGSLVILEGQQSRETDVSPPFSSLPKEKTVKPDTRRVSIE